VLPSLPSFYTLLYPALPVEVLERIIKYTFLRRTKLTPSSDPYPLNNTSHLLLVSKAFRDLCLPSFYHSITISRPSHYVIFFDPKDGILVGGEDGWKRWDLVKELSIVGGVRVPLVSTLPSPGDCSYVVAFDILEGHPLDVVCLMDTPSLPTRRQDPAWVETIGRDQAEREAIRARIDEYDYEEYYEDVDMSDAKAVARVEQTIEEMIDEVAWSSFYSQVSTQRAAFLVSYLLPCTTPAQLRMSVEGMVNYEGGGGFGPVDVDYGSLHLFWSSPPSTSSPPISLSFFIRSSLAIQSLLGTVGRIHLEDFPTSFIDEFVPWFEASREGIPSARRSRGLVLVRPPASWSWDLPDGSVEIVQHLVSLSLSTYTASV